MELVYVWMTSTYPDTIKYPQGYNLSPAYDFGVNYRDDVITLYENNNWDSSESIFKDEVIKNISVMVGENGAGKSTFLKDILEVAEEIHSENGKDFVHTIGPSFPNKSLGDGRHPHKYVFIFVAKDYKLHIYFSAEKIIFNTKRRYELHSIGNRNKTELYNSGDYPFSNISVIYLTNSQFAFTYRGISGYQGISALSLTPKTIDRIADKYYRLICGVRFGTQHQLSYETDALWRRCAYKEKKNENFQELIDILYYNSLFESGNEKNFGGKIVPAIGLYVANLPRLLKDYIGRNQSDLNIRGDVARKMKEVIDCVSDKFFLFLEESDLFTSVLYLNLIAEINFILIRDSSCFQLPREMTHIEEVATWIAENGDRLERQTKEYFCNAIDEIQQLLNATSRTRHELNNTWSVFVEDRAFSVFDLSERNFRLEFIYDKNHINNSEYTSVLSVVSRFAFNPNSFIIKYLRAFTPGMSSGERCLLNFFSWIDVVPRLAEIVDISEFGTFKSESKNNNRLKSDILLLLDEPDLYMHPQWQKNLIYELTNELNRQYKEMSIQIIMTTSSPLTLSDVPVANIIYIKYNRKDETREILPRKQGHSCETFGTDVYKLFKDSFFLSGGFMGTYAENYINKEILAPLNMALEQSNSGEIQGRINLKELRKKIELLGCMPLYKKALEMYTLIERRYKNDSYYNKR